MVSTWPIRQVMPMMLADLEWYSRIFEANGENEPGGSSAIDDDGTTDVCTFCWGSTGEIVVHISKCLVNGALEKLGRGEGSTWKA